MKKWERVSSEIYGNEPLDEYEGNGRAAGEWTDRKRMKVCQSNVEIHDNTIFGEEVDRTEPTF